MSTPPRPTPALIVHYLEKRDKLDNYRAQEDSLILLFHKLCPENKTLEHVRDGVRSCLLPESKCDTVTSPVRSRALNGDDIVRSNARS